MNARCNRKFSLTLLYVTKMTLVLFAAILVSSFVSGANMNKLLKHAGSFPPEAKESYKEKISFTGSVNPFALSDHLKLAYFVAAVSALPPADAMQ